MSKKKPKRNWSHYNKALIQRGSIFLWFNDSIVSQWQSIGLSGRKGRPRIYSDQAILLILTLRSLYRLPLRAIQGWVSSFFKQAGLNLNIPDYTTLSRRQKSCPVILPKINAQKSIHLVMDSTGLKVFGEGEWKVRTHGFCKRRTWRKLHLGIDEANGQIEAIVMTTNDFKDSELTEDLINQVSSPIKQASADGGYDSFVGYDYLKNKKIKPVIPPRQDAKIRQRKKSKLKPLARDQVLRDIRKLGLKTWKEKNGYHRRNIAETTMYRLKQLTGDRLFARTLENQWTEIQIRCSILNRLNTNTFMTA